MPPLTRQPTGTPIRNASSRGSRQVSKKVLFDGAAVPRFAGCCGVRLCACEMADAICIRLTIKAEAGKDVHRLTSFMSDPTASRPQCLCLHLLLRHLQSYALTKLVVSTPSEITAWSMRSLAGWPAGRWRQCAWCSKAACASRPKRGAAHRCPDQLPSLVSDLCSLPQGHFRHPGRDCMGDR